MKKKPAWSLEIAKPICERAAKRLIAKFRGLPQFDLEDLVAEGLKLSIEEHGTYPPHQPYDAWLRGRVRSRLLDRLRSAAADRTRCERVAEARHEAAEDGALLLAAHGLSATAPASTLVKGVGRRLRAARGRRPMADVARHSGVCASTIRELERGLAGDVHLSTLERLALVCRVQVRDLVPLEKKSFAPPPPTHSPRSKP